MGVGTLVFRRYLGDRVELTPGAVILKGPGETRRMPVEDILDVEERESGVVVLTKDLERVPMPFDSDRLRHGLRILLAHKKGSPGTPSWRRYASSVSSRSSRS
ncbi:PH domain-containing protein [Methanopyrus kandleri]